MSSNAESEVYSTSISPYFFCLLVVQSPSHVWLLETPWTAACQASLSFTISQSLPRFIFIELVMPSNHLVLCCPLLFLSSVFCSIRVFSDESALCIRWPKYWSFSFTSILLMHVQGWFPLSLTGLISCYWRDSQDSSPAPQFESINSSALCLLYGPALIGLYMTTGKTTALTVETFVGKVMSLHFNTLSRFVIAFLPRSNHFLISWLQLLI